MFVTSRKVDSIQTSLELGDNRQLTYFSWTTLMIRICSISNIRYSIFTKQNRSICIHKSSLFTKPVRFWYLNQINIHQTSTWHLLSLVKILFDVPQFEGRLAIVADVNNIVNGTNTFELRQFDVCWRHRIDLKILSVENRLISLSLNNWFGIENN